MPIETIFEQLMRRFEAHTKSVIILKGCPILNNIDHPRLRLVQSNIIQDWTPFRTITITEDKHISFIVVMSSWMQINMVHYHPNQVLAELI